METVLKAGEEVLEIYNKDFEVFIKEDESPVTTADLKAHHIIEPVLRKTGFPVLSEEGNHFSVEERMNWETYWLIDPIDGTKEFVNKTGEFCICVALIYQKKPILGILYAPVLHKLYFASEKIGSYLLTDIKQYETLTAYINNSNRLENNKIALEAYIFLTSVSFYDSETKKYVESIKEEHSDFKEYQLGSVLKLGYFAEGKASEYSRLFKLKEWDIAAGHAICKYAGYKMLQFGTDKELEYNNPDMKVEAFSVFR